MSCINEREMLQTKFDREIEKISSMSTVNTIPKELDVLENKHFLRITTSDATAKTLTALMNENNSCIGILSPDGGQFNIIARM